MIYSGFQRKQLSLLGFGTMRLPTLADGTIDEAQVAEMTAYAIEHGVNYFDTAYPYHGGESERVIGRVLYQQASPFGYHKAACQGSSLEPFVCCFKIVRFRKQVDPKLY